MSHLEITAGQTAPILVDLERQVRPGPFRAPDLTGATPHLTIESLDGLVLFAKDGTIVAPASTSGRVTFAPGALEIAPPPEDTPTRPAYYQVRVTYADGTVEYYPRQGEAAPCLIHRPLGV